MQQSNPSKLRWTVGGGDRQGKEPFLIVIAGGVRCALALGEVGEVLRPLAVTQVAGAPPEVAGVAVVRGRSLPVLRLAGLFDDEGVGGRRPTDAGPVDAGPSDARPAGRWVTLHDPKAPVLAVDAVERVRWLDAQELDRADLLSEAAAGAVGRLGALDRQILVCLETARIVEALDLPHRSIASDEAAAGDSSIGDSR
ncbi:MAG: chemotaxis protein CheW [Acidobacteriota bacterium]|nr:chemotaxis protein CheW [Acidobacteriota bacterium]